VIEQIRETGAGKHGPGRWIRAAGEAKGSRRQTEEAQRLPTYDFFFFLKGDGWKVQHPLQNRKHPGRKAHEGVPGAARHAKVHFDGAAPPGHASARRKAFRPTAKAAGAPAQSSQANRGGWGVKLRLDRPPPSPAEKLSPPELQGMVPDNRRQRCTASRDSGGWFVTVDAPFC